MRSLFSRLRKWSSKRNGNYSALMLVLMLVEIVLLVVIVIQGFCD